MGAKTTLRKFIRKFGYDLVSYDPRFNTDARKVELIRSKPIDYFLDVGANVGQFGSYLRSLGYARDIISFEPMKEEYGKLEEISRSDEKWKCFNLAMGAEPARTRIQRTSNSFSSSILTPTENNTSVHDGTKVVTQEEIEVRRLDTFIDELLETESSAWNYGLKIDTQGYEEEVIKGSPKTLEKTSLLILELSFKELYLGQPLIEKILPTIRDYGFVPSIIQHCDEDYSKYEVLQADIWFIRAD